MKQYKIRSLIKITVIFFLLFSGSVGFSDAKKPRTRVLAGRSVYKSSIRRLVMETKNGQSPQVIRGDSVMDSEIIINDQLSGLLYVFGDVVLQSTNQNQGNKDKTYLTSGQATFATRSGEIVVYQNPVIEILHSSSNKTIAKSELIKIYDDEDYMLMLGNANVENDDVKVSGEQIIIYEESGSYSISGNTSTEQSNTMMTADRVKVFTEAGDINNYTAVGNVFLEQEADGYRINSERLDYFKNVGYFAFSENVKALIEKKEAPGEKTELKSDQLNIFTTNENEITSYLALGNVYIRDEAEESIIQGDQLEFYEESGYMRVLGNAQISFIGKQMTASANSIEKFDEEEKANLNGNIVIDQGDKKAYGRWGEYDIKEKKIYITGNAMLEEGSSKLSAQKITVDVEKETMQMQGSGSGFFK